MKWFKRLLWSLGVIAALIVIAALGFWARPVSFFTEMMDLRMSLAGAESHSIKVMGYRVHYFAEGPASGPAVVLVHGLGARSEDWRDLAPFLSAAGYRVYMPDLPGYGSSEQPADFSYSIPDETRVVVGFLDALGLKQVDLGGWSMGGWIVQRLASEHPDRVRRLMLFDSAGLLQKPTWDTRLFTPTSPDELDQLNALLTPHPRKIPGFVAQDLLRLSRENAWVIHRALDTMLAGHDTTDSLLPQLKMPVLIVWGGEDHLIPLTQGQKIHALIPQSQLDVIPGCGHLAPQQCAAQIGPKVVEFVKQ